MSIADFGRAPETSLEALIGWLPATAVSEGGVLASADKSEDDSDVTRTAAGSWTG
jgi:hypothetical protein